MTPKKLILAKALFDAERTGKPVMVLNLNRYNPLYVIRDFDERLLFSDTLVAVVEPPAKVA